MRENRGNYPLFCSIDLNDGPAGARIESYGISSISLFNSELIMVSKWWQGLFFISVRTKKVGARAKTVARTKAVVVSDNNSICAGGDGFCSIIRPYPEVLRYIESMRKQVHRPSAKRECVQVKSSTTAQDKADDPSSEEEESPEEESPEEESSEEDESSSDDSDTTTKATKNRRRTGTGEESEGDGISNTAREKSKKRQRADSPMHRLLEMAEMKEKLTHMGSRYQAAELELVAVKRMATKINRER